ncbi:hypothetical protein D3C83_184640 [compost metagenome]
MSDRLPSLKSSVFWDPSWDHKGFYSEALNKTFHSKDHKRKVMDEMGVMEKA